MSNPIADPLVEGHDDDLDTDLVTVEATPEGLATVTLNRPERKNAFDAELISAMAETFETLHAAEHVRLVLLRGAGGMFSAGADLDWMRGAADRTEDDGRFTRSEEERAAAAAAATSADQPTATQPG